MPESLASIASCQPQTASSRLLPSVWSLHTRYSLLLAINYCPRTLVENIVNDCSTERVTFFSFGLLPYAPLLNGHLDIFHLYSWTKGKTKLNSVLHWDTLIQFWYCMCWITTQIAGLKKGPISRANQLSPLLLSAFDIKRQQCAGRHNYYAIVEGELNKQRVRFGGISRSLHQHVQWLRMIRVASTQWGIHFMNKTGMILVLSIGSYLKPRYRISAS